MAEPTDEVSNVGRRRRWASSGCMPDSVRTMFTQGERAAMSVIAYEFSQAGGYCWQPAAAIGRTAGVSTSTVWSALRIACAASLIERQRYVGRDHDIIVLNDRRWTSWLRKGRWLEPAIFLRGA